MATARRACGGPGRTAKTSGGVAGNAAEHRDLVIATVTPIGPRLGIVPTCAALGLPAEQRVAARAAVLATAYGAHTERFPGGLPQPPTCPTEVWINPPNAPVRSHAASRRPVLRLAHAAPVA